MAKLGINNLREGMVTLREVLDENGQTLIRANEELSAKHITLLKMWGIAELDVKYSKQEVDIDILLSEHPPNLVNDAIHSAEAKFKFFDEKSKNTHLLKKYFIEASLKGYQK